VIRPPLRRSPLVVVGTSWGGLEAVGRVLADLDGRCCFALVVVQHRGADSPHSAMVRYLQARSALPVTEVDDKDPIQPGHVYVAPPDYHLLIEPGHFALSLEAPVRYSRPSIDVLFESAAESYGADVVGVVLTGANADGTEGLRAIKAHGGRTIVQDPTTAERSEMPAAAVAGGLADVVLTIEEIAVALNVIGTDAPRPPWLEALT
jgi:two-component system, chemotaxis family, protein-glutamate methylesterase/glutaminase